MLDNSLKKGTIWTIIFFLSSFAKTIILTPLMLVHWGSELFSFWAIFLSVRAIILFLSDGFVRYIINEYNLLYHHNETKANALLASGLSFLLVFSLIICGVIALVFGLISSASSFVFNVEQGLFAYLPLCLTAYLVAVCIQNMQRMYAATKESRSLVWHNLLFEVLLLMAEILVFGVLISYGFGFKISLLVHAGVIVLLSVFYMVHLFVQYPLHQWMQLQSVRVGAQHFAKATQLYASNFFEKLSSDGLVLLLSFFRFDKAAIALFATVRTIVNTPLLAQNLLLNTYTPEMQKQFSLRDSAALEKLLHFIRLRLAPILCLGIVLCLPLYEPVFNYWTKGEIDYNDTFMILMLMMAVFNLYGLTYAFALKGVNALSQMFVVLLVKSLLLLLGFVWAKQNIIAFAWVLLWVEFLSSLLFLPLLSFAFWRKKGLQLKAKDAWLGLIPYFLTALILSLYFLFAHSLDSLNFLK